MFFGPPGRGKAALGHDRALADLLVVILRKLQPTIGQTKPKFPIFSPSLNCQLAACLRLLSIYVGCVPYSRPAFLCMRQAACWAFEGTQIGQSAKSLRSSDQFHGLSTA